MAPASKTYQPLVPRPPIEDAVPQEVHVFSEQADLHLARWTNDHGGCQVISLFTALSVFDVDILRALAHSEDEAHPRLRASLAHYTNDAYTTNLNYRKLGDLNADSRLLFAGIHDGLEETQDEEGKKKKKKRRSFQLLPTTLNNTVNALFQHVNHGDFNEILAVSFPMDGLEVAEIRAMMAEHPALIVKARNLPVKTMFSISQDYEGTVGFMVQLGLKRKRRADEKKTEEMGTKKKEKEEKESHMVTLFTTHGVKSVLRSCNDSLEMIAKVTKDTLVSADLKADGWRFDGATIMFLTARGNPLRKTRHEEQKEEEEEKEEKEEEEEEGDHVGLSRPRAKSSPRNVNPNVTFTTWPPKFTEETITLLFHAKEGKGLKRWVGKMSGGGYKCVRQKKFRCQAPTRTLLPFSSEDDAKALILRHKDCCPGIENGKTFDFPTQHTNN